MRPTIAQSSGYADGYVPAAIDADGSEDPMPANMGQTQATLLWQKPYRPKDLPLESSFDEKGTSNDLQKVSKNSS